MLHIAKGCLFLSGPKVDEIVKKYIDDVPKSCQEKQQQRDGRRYHITIVTSAEFDRKKITDKYIRQYNDHTLSSDIGLGKLTDGDNECYYIIVHCPTGDLLREKLSLPTKYFHITLGFKYVDIHREKALNSLVNVSDVVPEDLLIISRNKTSVIKQCEILEIYLNNYIQLNKNYNEIVISLAKIYILSKQFIKLNNLAEILQQKQHLYGYYIFIKLKIHQGEKIEEFIKLLPDLFNIEINDDVFHKEVQYILDSINGPPSHYNKTNKNIYYHYIKNNRIIRHKMPHYFSWAIPEKLAGMAQPDINDLEALHKMGIKNIITCLEKPCVESNNDIKVLYFDVTDRAPPSEEQMDQMIEIIDSGSTAVHCLGGIGRTNTVIACYMIYYYKKYKNEYISAEKCIKMVEDLRPKVLLTRSQHEFIKKFSNNLHNENSCKSVRHLPKLIICMGYPASGKTTVCEHISNYFDNVIRINQDEQSRSGCHELFSENIKNDKVLLIDGTNLDKKKRKEWIQGAFNPKTWCIFFDTPFEECRYRIVRRKNHPTVKGGLGILDGLQDRLEEPDLLEGFDKIFRVSKESEINRLLQDLKIDLPLIVETDSSIIKFTRTKHLINFGSATRDDLLCTKDEQAPFLKYMVYIEEKVDGANLGISITKEYKIQVQNRSHYVDSSYHAQFKLLDKWIAQHSSDIISILEPETEILYGEWLYMKHSINYVSLPSYFLAFDIFNTKNGRFLSRDKVSQRLKGTNIVQVPLIEYSKINSLVEFEALMKLKSSFYDGFVEGVYIRICDMDHTTHRAKIVRHDFISGDKFWNKNKIVINSLAEI